MCLSLDVNGKLICWRLGEDVEVSFSVQLPLFGLYSKLVYGDSIYALCDKVVVLNKNGKFLKTTAEGALDIAWNNGLVVAFPGYVFVRGQNYTYGGQPLQLLSNDLNTFLLTTEGILYMCEAKSSVLVGGRNVKRMFQQAAQLLYVTESNHLLEIRSIKYQ
jgi:hypothetical protein